MARDSFEVVVIGGGAAGIAAGRRLHDAGIDCAIVEARDRLGGRAWTVAAPDGSAIDLGCGWLHSAPRNPWTAVAEAEGLTVDKSPPPWSRPAMTAGFPEREQDEFRAAMFAFHHRVSMAAQQAPDVAAATLLEPGSRWNALID